MAPADRPKKTLLILLGVIAALVVVAVLTIVFTRGKPALLDESTPAGVVQRYAAAAVAGDETTAAAYLSDEVRADCPRLEQFRADNLAITLISTKERADSADVAVSIASFAGDGPFGSSESKYEDVFGLVKVDGGWRIVSAPWELTVCPNAGPK